MKKLTVTLSDDMYDILTFLQGQSEENNSQSFSGHIPAKQIQEQTK